MKAFCNNCDEFVGPPGLNVCPGCGRLVSATPTPGEIRERKMSGVTEKEIKTHSVTSKSGEYGKILDRSRVSRDIIENE